MSPVARVVRCFEVHVADAPELRHVEAKVAAAVQAQPPGTVVSTTDRIEHPPLMEVRLEGSAPAVLEVMASLTSAYDGLIRNDVVKVRRDGPGRGPEYPDPGIRLRIRSETGRADAVDAPGSIVPFTGAPVTVAIVDSGLMIEHPVIKQHQDRLWHDGEVRGRQFIDTLPEGDFGDQDGHGTMLAGTILAAAGDAPVKLLAAKFFDTANPAQPDNAARALDFAVEETARIIVLAWDVGLGSVALERAFQLACTDALIVIAAGNYGSDNDWHDGASTARVPVRYAKDYPRSTLVVMATDETDRKAWFSNYGRQTVDLAAPGVDVTTTRRVLAPTSTRTLRKFRRHSGTSPAAALVAGAAALLMSRYPGLTTQQIKQCLVDSDSVNKVPPQRCASEGRLNVSKALKKAAKLASLGPP